MASRRGGIMRKIRLFYCETCGTKDDRFVDDETTEVICTKCESPAQLQLSTPKYFGNSTGRSPSAVN